MAKKAIEGSGEPPSRFLTPEESVHIGDYLSRFTVGVVAVEPVAGEFTPTWCASGTLVLFGGRHGILTARHVAKAASKAPYIIPDFARSAA